MFVQIIKGRSTQPDAVAAHAERWRSELAPGAEGWLGSTIGMSDSGEVFLAARFASEDHARRNSDRPEPGQWWEQAEQLLDDVTFAESSDVDIFGDGPDRGEFVQVIEASVRDRDAANDLREHMAQSGPPDRDDVLGGVVVVFPDRMTNIVYFTDETSARAAEAGPPSEDDEMMMKQMEAAFDEPSYLDLRTVIHQRP